jgi:hypothetical protein
MLPERVFTLKDYTMKIKNITHADLQLSWEEFQVASTGNKKRLTYCADGDGFVVISETAKGYKLFDQGQYIRTVGSDLIEALQFAEHFMQTCGYKATFDHCLSYN